MKVCVTGGQGFLGRYITEQLTNAGNRVITYDRRDGYDILDDKLPLYLREYDIDCVIHLAGVLGTHELFDTPELAVETNVLGSLKVIQACHQTGTRFVDISMPDVFPSVYTATRMCGVRLASAWHNAYGLETAHVRAFNAFGYGQAYGPAHPQKIVPTFAIKAWRNEPLPIWGDGTQTVDLIHAREIGKVFAAAIHQTDDVTIDAGTGRAMSVADLAGIVLEVTGSTAGVETLPMRRGEVPTNIVAAGEGWDRLTDKPQFSIDELVNTVKCYRELA